MAGLFKFTPKGVGKNTIVCAIVNGHLKRSKPRAYPQAKRESEELSRFGYETWLEERKAL